MLPMKLKFKHQAYQAAVDCFEGNNLVLVDEGHRGSSGEEWMNLERKMTKGFTPKFTTDCADFDGFHGKNWQPFDSPLG